MMPRDNLTCWSDDKVYTDDEAAFLKAVDEYRRRTGRKFPTAVEYLRVAAELGYVKRPKGDPC